MVRAVKKRYQPTCANSRNWGLAFTAGGLQKGRRFALPNAARSELTASARPKRGVAQPPIRPASLAEGARMHCRAENCG